MVNIKAKKNIIVCAGIMSPSFLLHSGIGPECDLEKIGIPVVFNNLNVGRHISNQPLIIVTLSSNPDDMGTQRLNDLYVGGAFLPDPSVTSTARSIQLIGMNPSKGIMNIIIIPLFPKSTGFVEIFSSDPLASPVTNMNYLENPDDMATLKAAIRQVGLIANQMNHIDSSYKLLDPDPSILLDDIKLENFIRNNLSQNHHWRGSNIMGRDSSNAVVSPSGHVFGVKNLIVADASVLPTQVDGNTSAATYIVANIIVNKLLRKFH